MRVGAGDPPSASVPFCILLVFHSFSSLGKQGKKEGVREKGEAETLLPLGDQRWGLGVTSDVWTQAGFLSLSFPHLVLASEEPTPGWWGEKQVGSGFPGHGPPLAPQPAQLPPPGSPAKGH